MKKRSLLQFIVFIKHINNFVIVMKGRLAVFEKIVNGYNLASICFLFFIVYYTICLQCRGAINVEERDFSRQVHLNIDKKVPWLDEYPHQTICSALRDWYHLYNLKKSEKHLWRSGSFTKNNIPPWVLFTFLKLRKWYQNEQRSSKFLKFATAKLHFNLFKKVTNELLCQKNFPCHFKGLVVHLYNKYCKLVFVLLEASYSLIP